MLDPVVLPVFLLAVLALAVAPGPDLALIVSHSLANGARAGVWCSVGIALAGFVQTALVAVGLGQLMQRAPVVAGSVRLAGAAYLMWIGISLLRKTHSRHESAVEPSGAAGGESAGDWLRRGLVNNLLNPKALLFFSLFLPQFATSRGDDLPWQVALLGVILSLVVMAVNLSVAWAAGAVRRAFTPGGRFDHVSRRVLGLVFVGLGLRVVLAR